MKAQIRDFIPQNGGGVLTLTLCEDFRNTYDELHGKDIEVEFEKWSEKRSLNANSYMWVLCEKIAAAMGISKEEVYRKNIRESGGWKDKVLPKEEVEFFVSAWRGRGLGWFAEENQDMGGYKVIRFYYGSSCYSRRRMARLLDSVVQDAVSCEIDVRTPDEIAKLVSLWEAT